MTRAILTFVFFVASGSAGAQGAVEAAVQPSITVVGTGRVEAPSDRAIVRLGATIQRDEAASAQRELATVMAAAIEAILALGVQRTDVQTSSLSLRPVYADNDGSVESEAAFRRRAAEPRIAGYRATSILRITVDDLALIGDVVDAGIAAGANEIRGVSFALQDDLPQRITALERAAEVAARKARAAASALGVRLTEPLEIREQSVVVPYQELEPAFARTELAATQPIQPSEIAVEATVEVRYGIEAIGSSSGD